jgi:hypothetical protein
MEDSPMFARMRERMTFANTISLIALFVALGGTSYAAVKIPRNSVSAAQIKTGGVGSSEVKNRALRAIDFRAGELPAGAKGDKGDPGQNGAAGAPGAPGSARAFARIRSDGTLELEDGEHHNKGITQSMVQKNAGAPASESTGPGIYCLGGLGFQVRNAVVSLDNSDSLPAVPNVTGGNTHFIPSVATFKGPDLGRCDAAHGQVRVAITRVDQTNAPELVDHGFLIWLEG